MDYLSVIEMLNACHGPSGDERQIAATLKRLAEPYADECWVDTLGNLIVHKKGNGPKVMFAAHMDSIGLIVTHIDEKGYLSFGKLGGIRPESILHTPFRFKNGVSGVVSLRRNVSVKDMPDDSSKLATQPFLRCLPLPRSPVWFLRIWTIASPARSCWMP